MHYIWIFLSLSIFSLDVSGSDSSFDSAIKAQQKKNYVLAEKIWTKLANTQNDTNLSIFRDN